MAQCTVHLEIILLTYLLMPVPYVMYISMLYAEICHFTNCLIDLHRLNLVFVCSAINKVHFCSFCFP